MKPRCPSLLSRTSEGAARPFRPVFVLILSLIAFNAALGQAQPEQLEMSRFVIFSGVGLQGSTVPTGPGYGVQLGSSANIVGGSIGSLKLVKTTGNANVTGNIFSKGTIVLANGAKVTGRLAASNLPKVGGTILSAGSNANFGGNIDVNGNIVIGGGIVAGKVTHPDGTTYVGPAPGLGEFKLLPTLPDYPGLPHIATFLDYKSTAADISKTTAIDPVPHNSIKLSGNQTLTFKGPGTYTINSIDNKNGNTFVFDFKNLAGDIYLHVHNNVNLGKLDISIIGGGNASRIFMEVHGK
ncbi:MAG TPA: polymer-forming cytoskeletal protein, partial [Chryseolinea sp.]|nr:polymer-forming cytoskeletal protein [Chryseolinea sp.]